MSGLIRRPQHWDPEVHPEEELWVCPHCDAHLHVDSVPPDACPVCRAPSPEEEDLPEESGGDR